jgi:hypothetical protein
MENNMDINDLYFKYINPKGGEYEPSPFEEAAYKQRYFLLLGSDWTQMPDSPLSDEDKAAWATYRQALRDLPAQEGFPNVAFPTKPSPGE